MFLCIIEGSDKAGKSTLAKHLSEVFNLDVTHLSKPKTKDTYTEYSEMIADIKGPMIFDRSFLSEYVYATLWRGGCKITSEQFRDLELKLINKVTREIGIPLFVVHAHAPLEVIRERCIKEGEELLQLDQISKCQSLYRDIFSETSLLHWTYDSSVSKPESVSSIISEILKQP